MQMLVFTWTFFLKIGATNHPGKVLDPPPSPLVSFVGHYPLDQDTQLAKKIIWWQAIWPQNPDFSGKWVFVHPILHQILQGVFFNLGPP
jgi:hypothetical protein